MNYDFDLKIDFSDIAQSLLSVGLESSQLITDFSKELSSISTFLTDLSQQFTRLNLQEMSLTDEQSDELDFWADSITSSVVSTETRQVIKEDIKKRKISFGNIKAWIEFIAAVLSILIALGILTPEKAQDCFDGFKSTIQSFFISEPSPPTTEPEEILFLPESQRHL